MAAEPRKTIQDLIDVMAALRTPVTGCPWDLEQTFATIAPYTVEEAYEVADAIARGDRAHLCEELGDLLLQVVYHAQLGSEEKAFDFADVVDGITSKMIRRHPHVFGDDAARSAGAAKGFWDKIKAEEKAGKPVKPASILEDVPLPLPALTRAIKLQDKAAAVGFDWPNLGSVLIKMSEELGELEQAVIVRRRGPHGGRIRRPAVRDGERRPAHEDRPGRGAAPGQPQIHPPLPAHRGAAGRAGQNAGAVEPRRDGQAVGSGQGRGVSTGEVEAQGRKLGQVGDLHFPLSL